MYAYALWDTILGEWARLCSMGVMYTSLIEDEITIAVMAFDTEEEADKARKTAFGDLWETYEIRRFPA